MTFRVVFFAEKAYLSFVKESLTISYSDHEKEVERGAVCAIALACALEAIVNSLLANYTSLRHYDDLRFRSKIDTLFDLGKLELAWDKLPLQRIASLIRLRDWLVHYKNSDIGLINSEGQWIVDALNKQPKHDPDAELVFKNIELLYRAVLDTAICLAEAHSAEEEFAYLRTEEFGSFLVG